MACDELEKNIKYGIQDLKKANAPGFVITDYIEEMNTGEATMCQECEKKTECWEE